MNACTLCSSGWASCRSKVQLWKSTTSQQRSDSTGRACAPSAVYCMLFLQVSGAHLQPLPVTWCRNLTAILRSASQFEPRSSTIHIPLLCLVEALKQSKQMVKDKKVADYTCILPTMLCITKKKLISSEGHVRARDSAHTAGFSQSGQGFLMTSWKVIWWTQETRLLAAVRWHKPAAYESNTPFLCFPWGIPRCFRMIE